MDDYAPPASVIPNINGSPYHRGKTAERLEVLRGRAAETGAWIVYVNAVGGQDELVFDGGSMVVAPDGTLAWHAAMFEEDLLVVDHRGPRAAPRPEPPPANRRPDPRTCTARSHSASATTSARTGSREVVLGLSGGIDSALVGDARRRRPRPGRGRTLAMPSPYSRQGSVTTPGTSPPPRHPVR